MQQLLKSAYIRANKLQLLSLLTTVDEACMPKARAPQEKRACSSEDPAEPEINK